MASQILIDAFGYDRVSLMSLGESDLDEYREWVRRWAEDPRSTRPTNPKR